MSSDEIFTPYSHYTHSEELEEILLQHGLKVDIPANKTIIAPYEEPFFYYITDGRLRVTIISEDGEEKILSIIKSHSFEGVISLLVPDDISYITTEIPTAAIKLDEKTFWKLINTSELFREIILKDIASIVHRGNTLIAAYSFKNCKQRLYELLVATIDEDSLTEGWYKLVHQYTQQDMAKIVGSTRITVTRLLSELRHEGLIRNLNNEIEMKQATP
jgi:CRP-like cAMP-binding protein